MTGPDHYREAERLLDSIDATRQYAVNAGASGETMKAAVSVLIDMAQVHATLALAAATVAAAERYVMDGEGHASGKVLLLDPMGRKWTEAVS